MKINYKIYLFLFSSIHLYTYVFMYNIHSINKNKNTRKTEELKKKIAKFIHVLLLSKNSLVKMLYSGWSLLYTIKGSNSNVFLRRKLNYSSEFGSERIRVDQT